MMSSYALIYLIAYVVPAAVSFLAIIIYTHLLSPAEYGIYVIGTGIATIISAIAFTWVRHSVWRYQAASPHVDLRPEAAVAFGATVGFIALLAPIALFVMRPGIGFGVLAASALSALSLTAFDLSQEFKRAKLNPVRFTTIAVARSFAALGLGFAAIEWGGGGLGLLVAISVSYLVGIGMNLWRDLPQYGSFSSKQLRQFARYGLPFTVGAVAVAVHGSLDKLSVAYLLDQSAAGQYGLGASIARQLVDVLAASVAAAMFPIVFRSFAQAGPAATRERLSEGFELQFALIVPVAVWLAMSSGIVTSVLLSAQFQASVAAILPVLAIGRILGATNQFYIQISFQLAEKPFLQVVHDGLTLTLNIVLIFPLTRAFGLPGAAASVLVAEAVGIVAGIWLSRWAFRLPFNGWGIARVLAATAVMALVTYAAQMASRGHGPLTLAAVAAAGGLAYLAAVIALDVAGVRTSVAAALSLRAGGSRFPL